jgi:thioester reductase-like protein
MEKEGLGLSAEDRQFLLSSHISVVFHIAASLSFHEPPAKCVKTNAIPVIELIGLCEEMPELKVNKSRSVYKYTYSIHV